MLINQLRVHPLVKRAAVVEHSIDYNPDSFLVGRYDKRCEKLIAGL